MDKTRSAVNCPLFGGISELKENILPTYEDVTKFWEWTRYDLKSKMKNPKEPLFSDIAEIVSSKIEEIWAKASLPIVSRTRIVQMLKAYHLKCKNTLRSIKRLTNDQKQTFLTKSRVLFDISSCKCIHFDQCICSKPRKVPKAEQMFLIDQRTSRNMVIGGLDIKTSKKLQKRIQREITTQKRHLVTNCENVPVKKLRRHTSNEKSSVQNDTLISTTVIPIESNSKVKKLISFDNLTHTCDRYGISDRAAAAIASSVLTDIQSEVDIIDRHKIRRKRKKIRTVVSKNMHQTDLTALYFDGRKDKTITLLNHAGKNYRTTVVEEHVSLIKEPGSIYLGYVVPSSGTAKDIVSAVRDYLTEQGTTINDLQVIGCDGTNVNTGKYGGVMRLMEKELQKPLQWIVCLLHMNELPLRHIFLHLDGATSGPRTYTGSIGKLLENCEQMPVVSFQPIEVTLPPVGNDLSTDQLYLHRIVSAVSCGNFPDDLLHKSPGKLSHARWLTRANRILRLYVATDKPSRNLIVLTTFVIKVYAPVWFIIKSAPSSQHAAIHFYEEVKRSRYLSSNLKKIVDPVLRRNAYAAHPENLLLSMLTDEQQQVRELAIKRILQARRSAPSAIPRLFEVPKINLNATTYVDLINWNTINVTMPPVLQNLTDDEIKAFAGCTWMNVATCLSHLPNHTQAVERAVKITTEASVLLCDNKTAREGLIKTRLASRKTMPKFETKKDFRAVQ